VNVSKKKELKKHENRTGKIPTCKKKFDANKQGMGRKNNAKGGGKYNTRNESAVTLVTPGKKKSKKEPVCLEQTLTGWRHERLKGTTARVRSTKSVTEKKVTQKPGETKKRVPQRKEDRSREPNNPRESMMTEERERGGPGFPNANCKGFWAKNV